MQACDGLDQAFQRGRDVLALVEVAEQQAGRQDFLSRRFRHHLADDRGTDIVGLQVADVAESATIEPYFGRVVGDQPGEEAVERPEREPMHREQGIPEELAEKCPVALGRQLEPGLDLGRLGLGGGGLGQLIQGLGHELPGGGAGEGQGDDLLRLDAAFQDLLVGEELDDTVREGIGLARSGRGEDDLVPDGELGRHGVVAHGRVPPSCAMFRYLCMGRPFKAFRRG